MTHNQKPGAAATASGLIKVECNKYLASNDIVIKPPADPLSVENLRAQTLKARFSLPAWRIEWLSQNAFGEVANDR